MRTFLFRVDSDGSEHGHTYGNTTLYEGGSPYQGNMYGNLMHIYHSGN